MNNALEKQSFYHAFFLPQISLFLTYIVALLTCSTNDHLSNVANLSFLFTFHALLYHEISNEMFTIIYHTITILYLTQLQKRNQFWDYKGFKILFLLHLYGRESEKITTNRLRMTFIRRQKQFDIVSKSEDVFAGKINWSECGFLAKIAVQVRKRKVGKDLCLCLGGGEEERRKRRV